MNPKDPAASTSFTAGDCASSACCKVILNQDSTPDACDNQPVYIGNGIWQHTISIAESTGKTVTYAFTDAAASERFAYKATKFVTVDDSASAFYDTTATVSSASVTSISNAIDALWEAAEAELTNVPGTSPSIKKMIQWVYANFAHKKSATDTTQTLYQEDGTTELSEQTVATDGVTTTRGTVANP